MPANDTIISEFQGDRREGREDRCDRLKSQGKKVRLQMISRLRVRVNKSLGQGKSNKNKQKVPIIYGRVGEMRNQISKR